MKKNGQNLPARYQIEMEMKIGPRCRRRKESKFKPKRIIAPHTHNVKHAKASKGMSCCEGAHFGIDCRYVTSEKLLFALFVAASASALLTIFFLASNALSLSLARSSIHLRSSRSSSSAFRFKLPTSSHSATPSPHLPYASAFPKCVCSWLLFAAFWQIAKYCIEFDPSVFDFLVYCVYLTSASAALQHFILVDVIVVCWLLRCCLLSTGEFPFDTRIGFSCAYCAFRISLHI